MKNLFLVVRIFGNIDLLANLIWVYLLLFDNVWEFFFLVDPPKFIIYLGTNVDEKKDSWTDLMIVLSLFYPSFLLQGYRVAALYVCHLLYQECHQLKQSGTHVILVKFAANEILIFHMNKSSGLVQETYCSFSHTIPFM